MNDKPLSVGHGFPVRVVTPGIAGARSVKWLNQITVQMKESENHYQHFDCKVLPPEVTNMEEAKQVWETIPAVQEMPVNSVIAWPQSGSTVQRDADGTVGVAGYALPSSEDGPVVKVEVSVDGVRSWRDAELIAHPEQSKWSWKLWQARVEMDVDPARICIAERPTEQEMYSRSKASGIFEGCVTTGGELWKIS